MAVYDGDESKIQKANVDRISNLAEDVISKILSLLPTREAVGTSILSKRWKYLWTSITSFDLRGPLCDSENSRKKDFMKFSDNVFRSCTSLQIQKFSLRAFWVDQNRVNAWIGKAVKRNPSEVNITVNKLSLSIFSCKTVSNLKLCVSAISCGDVNNCNFELPSLKVLHIIWEGGNDGPTGFLEKLISSSPVLEELILDGYLADDENIGSFNPLCLKILHIKFGSYYKGPISLMEKLISSCPILEDLTLSGCLGDDHFRASSPALKTLRFQLFYSIMGPIILSVDAPKLQYLSFDDDFVNNIILGDFSSLVQAHVTISGLRFPREVSIQHSQLPVFCNLRCLEVIIGDTCFWAILPTLLENSPSLKVLSLEQGAYNYECAWVRPKSIPECLLFHLEVFKIKGFKGKTLKLLELIRYFLRNATVLKSVSINCQGLTQVEERQFFGHIMKLLRASKSCQIQCQNDCLISEC